MGVDGYGDTLSAAAMCSISHQEPGVSGNADALAPINYINWDITMNKKMKCTNCPAQFVVNIIVNYGEVTTINCPNCGQDIKIIIEDPEKKICPKIEASVPVITASLEETSALSAVEELKPKEENNGTITS